MYERIIVINGVLKIYVMIGWRLGYVVVSEKIIKFMISI